MGKIANAKLAESGEKNFLWAKAHMGALSHIAAKYAKSKPLEGQTVAVCLHTTKETSVLVDSLLIAGADVKLCAANPISTQDDIAAYLATRAEVWAWRGQTAKEYDWCIEQVLKTNPDLVIDDGADMHVMANLRHVKSVKGGNEETTTGVIRVKALEKDGKLAYPIMAINNAKTKFLFDNRFGTGQSTFDGILRATALLMAGKRIVVIGYGWVGKGVAKRARGLDAKVTVVEIDPIKALEAYLDGFEVTTIHEAAKYGEIFITCTGQKHVVPFSAIEKMRDGAILSNAGHFDVEIDVKSIMEKAKSVKEGVRPNTDEITLQNGKKIYLLGKGRIVNLVAAEGHPPEVMQMSFATQFISALYVNKNHAKLKHAVIDPPPAIEDEVARSTLEALGLSIDKPTKEQMKYGESWALE